eukprot:380687-Hanusia_phi.AAC.4
MRRSEAKRRLARGENGRRKGRMKIFSKGREQRRRSKRREGKGREGKGREGKGREENEKMQLGTAGRVLPSDRGKEQLYVRISYPKVRQEYRHLKPFSHSNPPPPFLSLRLPHLPIFSPALLTNITFPFPSVHLMVLRASLLP